MDKIINLENKHDVLIKIRNDPSLVEKRKITHEDFVVTVLNILYMRYYSDTPEPIDNFYANGESIYIGIPNDIYEQLKSHKLQIFGSIIPFEIYNLSKFLEENGMTEPNDEQSIYIKKTKFFVYDIGSEESIKNSGCGGNV